MNKIGLFRDVIVAPVRKDRTGDRKSATVHPIRRDGPQHVFLVAVWSRNPATGRLERRWTTARAAVADDGSNRSTAFRHAA